MPRCCRGDKIDWCTRGNNGAEWLEQSALGGRSLGRGSGEGGMVYNMKDYGKGFGFYL